MTNNEIHFEVVEFQWDEGNINKNRFKHGVDKHECEEIFFNRPIIIFDDEQHSEKEKRYKVLGKTDRGRKMSLVFTLRSSKIRIITARDQSKKEKELYEKEL